MPSGEPTTRTSAAAGTGAGAVLIAALAASAGGALCLPATLVVGAHPDDETVGAGSRLQRLRHGRFVCVTDGAPQDGQDAARHGLSPPEYAKARRQELEAALARCGVGADRIESLGCPDQQASLNLAPLATRLADVMLRHRTEAVLTHPYEGGHPDHDATAFIVHAAAALLGRRGAPSPDVVEWTSYRRGADGALTTGFLPAAEVDAQTVTIHLTPEELRRKLEVLACHATQRDTLRNLPMHAECYRPAPRYDFTRPPHEWKLNYEHHPWGMTGERFRTLAAQAMSALQLEGPL
jgi:N-acetylglucosamine malate deacetylase 2